MCDKTSLTCGAAILLYGIVSAVGAQESSIEEPFSPEELQRIARWVSEAPRALEAAPGRALRIVSISPAQLDKTADVEVPATRRVAEVITATYMDGRGQRILLDARTGELIAISALAGRPQSSAAERAAAEALLRADVRVAKLLGDGHRLVGGFVVDGPDPQRPGRYLEYHIADAEGRRIAMEVVVDLAAGSVVAVHGDSVAGK